MIITAVSNIHDLSYVAKSFCFPSIPNLLLEAVDLDRHVDFRFMKLEIGKEAHSVQ